MADNEKSPDTGGNAQTKPSPSKSTGNQFYSQTTIMKKKKKHI